MKKIFLCLLFFFNSFSYANNKPVFKSVISNYVVDEWVVEVKSYYNQSAGSKIAKSKTSLIDAENNALNSCKEDKTFNANKPEGCLISKRKETYENSWRYFMGTKPPEPEERDDWFINKYTFEYDLEQKQQQKQKEIQRITEEKNKEHQRTVYLEKEFGKKCSKYFKSSDQYNNCLLEQERIVKETESKKLLVKQEQERKQLEAEQAKRKTIEDKQKDEANKLAKMSPDDRRAYTCSEKFGFRKGSDNFKECVFKIYSAEIELEKLELQKQLAKANADLAKANAASNQKLADAQTSAAIMQAYAAQQQAIAANTADSLALINQGLSMMSPQRPAARAPMNCQYHARMLSCF